MGKYFYFLFFLYVLTDLRSFQALNVECNYNNNTNYASLSYIYKCEVTKVLNIKTLEDAVIESVSGTHMSGKTNDDVLGFHADSKLIEYFPKELEKFFKNLKIIFISRNKIKQISQSDLMPFSNLIHFEARSNNVEILEDGLFDNNPNMLVVWFDSNKIYHVGKNVFSYMNSLTWLGFGNNSCIDMNTWNNSTAVKLIIDSLKIKCFDVNFANFSKKFLNIENESKTLTFDSFPIWSKKLENLETEFKSSKFSYLVSIMERFQVLNAKRIEDFPEYLVSKFEDFGNNLKDMFTESCTEVNYQTLNIMKDDLSKINEKQLEHSSEVRSELIKNDVQHSAILNEISNLKEKLESLEGKFESLEEKLGQIWDAVKIGY